MNRSRVLADLVPPAGWEAVPAGAVLTPVTRTGYPDEQLLSVSKYRGVQVREDGDSHSRPSEDLSHYLLTMPGDLVVNIMLAWDRGLGVTTERGLVSPAYATYTVDEGRVDSRFLDYQVRSEPAVAEWRRRSYGIQPSRWRLYWERMSSAKLPLPPLDTQRRIADMLDAETARIDTLIEKNQRVREIALLRETVAISEVVGSGGLHVGGYQTGALRWFDVDIQTGPFGTQLHADEYITGAWPVCNPSNIRDGRLVADESVTVGDETWERLARHHLKLGDIVFGRRGEMGRAALVSDAEVGWVCGTGCLVVRLRNQNQYLAEFLMEVLSSWGVRAWFDQMSVGSTMQNLNETVLGSLPVPAVPIDVQRKALEDVRSIRKQHAALRARVARQQELLRLRRQALITAAVTGEIEI